MGRRHLAWSDVAYGSRPSHLARPNPITASRCLTLRRISAHDAAFGTGQQPVQPLEPVVRSSDLADKLHWLLIVGGHCRHAWQVQGLQRTLVSNAHAILVDARLTLACNLSLLAISMLSVVLWSGVFLACNAGLGLLGL